MTGLSILLLLLMPPQDPKKVETPAERAKKAAARATIIFPPPIPAPARPTPAIIQIGPNIVFQQVQANVKTMILEAKEVPTPDDPNQDRGAIQPARPMQIEEFALSSSNFDSWVFESDLTEEARKDHLGSILAAQILPAKSIGAITPEQEEKLLLAGRGDIRRFLNRTEAARAHFETVRQDFNSGRVALGQLETLAAEYQAGPFGPGSLLEKSWTRIRGGQDKKRQGRK